MDPEEVPNYWCRSDQGGICRPGGGKRKVVSRVSNSDIRVSAALANANCVQDCRNKTLYEICMFVIIRHVNSISWDNVCQHIAADILHAAHTAGTIADETVTRLVGSPVHTNFITALDLSCGRAVPNYLWKDRLSAVANTLRSLDLTGCSSVFKCNESWITRSLLHLRRLEWLSLCRCKLQDDTIKKLVYPTKYSNKGLTKLRYFDISENPDLTEYAVSLARSFPSLQTLITSPRDQKYFIFPGHELLNWGHDIVYRWISGITPIREGGSKFYKSDKGLSCQTAVKYKRLEPSYPASSSHMKTTSSRASDTLLKPVQASSLSLVESAKMREKENNFTLCKTTSFNHQLQSTRKKRGIKLIGSCYTTNKKQKLTSIPKLESQQAIPDETLGYSSLSVMDCYRTSDQSSKDKSPNHSLFQQLDSGTKSFYS